MAGDWIKIQCATPDKPEIYQLAEALDITPEHAFGCVACLWIWADQQLQDCNAHGVTQTLLDRKSGVIGMTQALLSVGWLQEKCDESGHRSGYVFVNFDRHNGKSAKKRAATNARVAKSRAKQQAFPEGSSGSSDAVTPTALPEKSKEENSTEKETSNLADRDVVAGKANRKAEIPSAASSCQHHLVTQTWNHFASEQGYPLVNVTLWSGSASADNLRQRWRWLSGKGFDVADAGLWQLIFQTVHENPTWNGSSFVGSAGKPFKADLHWIIKKQNFEKVLNRLAAQEVS